jgi:hypothetical protein
LKLAVGGGSCLWLCGRPDLALMRGMGVRLVL